VAPVGEVVEVSGKDVSIGAWHRDGSMKERLLD
jgi:hypothetical protein